jgi:polysaccharide export outer membrane protein
MLLAALLATSGCATFRADELVTSGPRYEAPSKQGGYALGVGDQVRVIVYSDQLINNLYKVGPDGLLMLPLIGGITASGRSTGDVQAEATRRYADGYFLSPSVSIQVERYRPVYVLGEVGRPGVYDYAPDMTAASLIASASGFTPRAKKTYVFISAEGEGAEHPYEVTPALHILPGDTVRVVERYF